MSETSHVSSFQTSLIDLYAALLSFRQCRHLFYYEYLFLDTHKLSVECIQMRRQISDVIKSDILKLIESSEMKSLSPRKIIDVVTMNGGFPNFVFSSEKVRKALAHVVIVAREEGCEV